jgi:hypothetical protein
MGIAQSVALFIPNCFQELVDPNRGIDGETFAIQGSKVCRPRAGLNDSPEAVHTHDDEMGTRANAGMRGQGGIFDGMSDVKISS